MLTIQTKTGAATVAPVWQGAALAVHPPFRTDGARTRGQWTVTHCGTGRSAAVLHCDKRRAVAIARQWDGRFLTVDPAAPRSWPWAKQWAAAVDAINRPWADPGLTADDGATETAAALAARAGLPIDQAGGSRRIWWRGKFWAAPTDAQLEWWTFDSVAETPDGRTVEPDHPESWLSILCLV